MNRTTFVPGMMKAALIALLVSATVGGATLHAQEVDPNEPGILEPVTSVLQDKVIRVPNTDQSVDGVEQSLIEGTVVIEPADTTTSLLGHPITQQSSPNEDMRLALQDMATAAAAGNQEEMKTAALELASILFGTTEGRIYDGFGMLNFNRWTVPWLGAEHFPADAVVGEYKMKVARDSGKTFISPYDGAERKIWEMDINMLYYDGQIDSDTFLARFPIGHDPDDVLHVNYRIYTLVEEDFSPTLVMLDRREAPNTVNFPFKGFDAVWVAMKPGEVVNLTVRYPPVRQIRGVYDWGWREHPPRIQFLQPIYEIENQWTGEVELDPQSESFATRNREDLTLETIGGAAPEKKMYQAAREAITGADPAMIDAWLTDPNEGPRGTWIEWAELAGNQTQLPAEAWDVLAVQDDLPVGEFGSYRMVTVFMNNEMYGQGPFLNEVQTWKQGDRFEVKLINLDNHTHYFRNVDFSARQHDDIGRCCGGGLTSFEIMNFKPSFGAPKVAEMQFRAGWGFRPHHDIIQQQGVFPRGRDRMGLSPYTAGDGSWHYGYQYSAAARGGDFRFNPPPFVITNTDDPAEFPLRDFDGVDGLLVGRRTPGYGVAQMCPGDPAGTFCESDISQFNPHAALNWPDPGDPEVPKTELRFPGFLRNPEQGAADAGDIIPPTSAWRPFLWISPANGTLYIDPENPDLGYWSDLTFSHGAPVFAGESLDVNFELPRSSGQLFYQFDDLFHDNSIFSPHPVATGTDDDEIDAIEFVRTRLRISDGELKVVGRLERYVVSGAFSPWISVYDGAAGETGCTGSVLGVIRVKQKKGIFADRMSDTGVGVGQSLCIQTIIGGFAEVVVE